MVQPKSAVMGNAIIRSHPVHLTAKRIKCHDWNVLYPIRHQRYHNESVISSRMHLWSKTPFAYLL